MCVLLAQHHMRRALAEGHTQHFHGEKPVLLLLWCIFLLQSNTRETIPTELVGNSACPLPRCLQLRLQESVLQSRAEAADHKVQRPEAVREGPSFTRNPWECGSSSSLVLQCHLPCPY